MIASPLRINTPQKVADLDTPALIIDLDIMERNLRRMAEYTAAHGLRLRPHTKTHKIPALARQQIDLGAVGLTIAKVGEAEVMLEADPPDLLLAYPIVGQRKLDRLMEVAKRAPVTVSLDSLPVARELSDAAKEAGVESVCSPKSMPAWGALASSRPMQWISRGTSLTFPHCDSKASHFTPATSGVWTKTAAGRWLL